MSTSRSSSHVSARHNPSRSVSYSQSVLPDGPVDEETVELLGELVNPHHEQEETLVDEEDEFSKAERERKRLPWWRRPSPLWLLCLTPLSTICSAATLAPKIEIYNLLACSVHKPEIFRHRHFLPSFNAPSEPSELDETTYPPSFDIALNTNSSIFSLMSDLPTKECSSDPTVIAAVAKLTATLTTSMGVLGCLTTGFWGAFSDRYGRSRILALTVFGVLVNDLTFIFVTKNFRHIPGGYWFLIVGPIFEGLLGGISAGSAASHAYISDTTRPSERSRYFSLFLGLVFVGFGIGPTLGGLIVRYAGVLSVFYMATIVHGTFAFLALIALPESLMKDQMQAAKASYQEIQRVLSEQQKTFAVRVQRVLAFLQPLTIFFPEMNDPDAAPLKGRKRDWNLTLLALSYGFTVSIMGSLGYKMQYVIATYEWTSENMGYFLTISGVTRAAFLAVILPVTIKLVKKFQSHRLSRSELEPLLIPPRQPHSASFDISLARISLFIEIIAYTAMPFATTGLAFTAFTMLAAFGSGSNPAVQSVAMELYSKRMGANVEAGRLFGAVSVIQALGGQILGPAVYGLIFVKTAATFPQAIFVVSTASVIASFICLSLVRLPTDVLDAEESHLPDHGVRDATLVDVSAGSGDAQRRMKAMSTAVPAVTVSAPTP
ncbi:MFS domain-containing protein [Favolaschia claudopus]|uniref:MFS domain-containing protein n=1 Tax=Favolaschia claudopus TaxID=2862362 RepID=A0AAW0B434_9AGAR